MAVQIRALRSVSFGNTGVTLREGEVAEVKSLSRALAQAVKLGWFRVVNPHPNIKAVDLTALLAKKARQRPPPKAKPKLKVEPRTAWERILEENF